MRLEEHRSNREAKQGHRTPQAGRSHELNVAITSDRRVRAPSSSVRRVRVHVRRTSSTSRSKLALCGTRRAKRWASSARNAKTGRLRQGPLSAPCMMRWIRRGSGCRRVGRAAGLLPWGGGTRSAPRRGCQRVRPVRIALIASRQLRSPSLTMMMMRVRVRARARPRRGTGASDSTRPTSAVRASVLAAASASSQAFAARCSAMPEARRCPASTPCFASSWGAVGRDGAPVTP